MSASLKNRRMWYERTSELTLHIPAQLRILPCITQWVLVSVHYIIYVTDIIFQLLMQHSSWQLVWPIIPTLFSKTFQVLNWYTSVMAMLMWCGQWHHASRLSRVLSQHCSRFHGAPLLNLADACAAGIPHWMWMSSPRWLLFPVQLATGNNSDNTNSHWSTISDLLLVYYGGGLWPQAVICGSSMSGPTQGKAIRIYYAKWSSLHPVAGFSWTLMLQFMDPGSKS